MYKKLPFNLYLTNPNKFVESELQCSSYANLTRLFDKFITSIDPSVIMRDLILTMSKVRVLGIHVTNRSEVRT